MRHHWRPGWCALVLAAALGLTGCGSSGFSGIYAVPLPGGAALGGHPYQVTAEFANAVDLVPQSAVKVNDVAIGRVTRIWLPPGSWTAHVSMLVNGDVHLPANAIAQVTQSSLLGEQYVSLSAPPGLPAEGQLTGGVVIPLARTTTNATVEEVLGALSLLLNDGGINQIRAITTQLDAALGGNEPEIRSLLAETRTLVANLNRHRGDIITALDGLDSLSASLRSRDAQIGNVLTNLTPGLRVLADQRAQLVGMLDALHSLTGVAVRTIDASQADLVADLRDLTPVLRELGNAGQSLPLALQVLLTYPFTDQVDNDVQGDYINAYQKVTAVPGSRVIAPVTPPTPPARRGGH